jgi:hypothetical protein
MGIPVLAPRKLPNQVAVVCWTVPVQLTAVRLAVDVSPGVTAVGSKARRVIYTTPEHDGADGLAAAMPKGANASTAEASTIAANRRRWRDMLLLGLTADRYRPPEGPPATVRVDALTMSVGALLVGLIAPALTTPTPYVPAP